MNTPHSITIPAPSIETGPDHLTPTEAAEFYLRDTVSRVKQLGHGSGVTALVDRLLADVIDALAGLNACPPERVTLAAHEASHLVGDDIAFWVGNGFMSRDDLLGKVCWWVTRAAASREAEVRGQVKADLPDVHAYAVEVLVNAGSSHPYWMIWSEESTYYDDFSAADSERAWLIDDGYRPEHVRVVEISVARIAGGDR